MGQRTKQMFLQGRHADGWQTTEKMLNITHYQRNAFLLQPGTVQTGLTWSNREPEREQFKWDLLIRPPWETVRVAGQSQILWVWVGQQGARNPQLGEAAGAGWPRYFLCISRVGIWGVAFQKASWWSQIAILLFLNVTPLWLLAGGLGNTCWSSWGPWAGSGCWA